VGKSTAKIYRYSRSYFRFGTQDKVTGTDEEKAAAAKRFADINNGRIRMHMFHQWGKRECSDTS